jgi:nucleotide-binding universal stress UspA family protein
VPVRDRRACRIRAQSWSSVGNARIIARFPQWTDTMPKQILVGYDDSPAAQRALQFAFKLAQGFGAELQVVYAAMLPAASPEATASLMADSKALRPGLSQKVLESAAQAGVKTAWKVVPGSAGDVLLAEIKTGSFEHLVIGNSGRGALARWLLGSVMGEVVENSQVPVTVVP